MSYLIAALIDTEKFLTSFGGWFSILCLMFGGFVWIGSIVSNITKLILEIRFELTQIRDDIKDLQNASFDNADGIRAVRARINDVEGWIERESAKNSTLFGIFVAANPETISGNLQRPFRERERK